MKHVINWWDVICLYFNSGILKKIKLRNGIQFNVRHHLDVLTIKEIFIDDDYSVLGKKVKTVIDIGANIGVFSVLVSKNIPNSKIYSFEPAIKTFNLFEKNISLNNIKNVIAYNVGVSGRKKDAFLYVGKASGLSSTMNRGKGFKKQKIKMITLSNIFNKNNLKDCDFLKMDCEGGEFDILLNTDFEVLKRVKNYAIEYHDQMNKHSHLELVRLFDKLNYKIIVKEHKIEPNIGIIYASK